MELHELTIQQLASELNHSRVSAREVTEQLFARIEKYDGPIHGFLELHREAALAKAEQIDQQRGKGQVDGRG